MSSPARTLVMSQRRIQPWFFRHSGYEFEGVIRDVDAATLVAPEYRKGDETQWWMRGLRRVGRAASLEVRGAPKVAPPQIHGHFDLLFVVATGLHDLARFAPWIRKYRRRCKMLACYVEEMWNSWLGNQSMIDATAGYDHIFLGCHGSVEGLQKRTGIPVTYLAPAVDMFAFCPYPDPPKRTIAVRAMGRRAPATHESLRVWADRTGETYLYDSTRGLVAGQLGIHRQLQAGLIKRSRYFLVNPAKVTVPEQTLGQQEIGLRFVEGAAGGAVLLGERPRVDTFHEHFGWEDSVIDLPFDSVKAPEIIEALEQQPQRIAAIRQRNVVECLRRHDWAHRWSMVLDRLALRPQPQLARRRRQLDRLADALCERPGLGRELVVLPSSATGSNAPRM